MDRTSTVRARTSSVVRRILTAVTGAFALVVLASTRAAALVPSPDNHSSGHAPVPPASAVDASSGPLLWVALAAAVLVLVATTVLAATHRRSSRRQTAGAAATA